MSQSVQEGVEARVAEVIERRRALDDGVVDGPREVAGQLSVERHDLRDGGHPAVDDVAHAAALSRNRRSPNWSRTCTAS